MGPVATGRWAKSLLMAVVGISLCGGAFLYFRFVRKRHAPATIVVSECKSASAALRKIQVGDNFAFFANTSTLIYKGQMDDTPPFTQRFCVKSRNSKSPLTISLHEPLAFGGTPVDPMLVFSEHSEKRHVVDDAGRVIGEEYWGYLDSEKRWRKVRLEGVSAQYGPVTKSDAEIYDRILSSACFSNH